MAELPPKLVQFLEMIRAIQDRGDRIETLIAIADRFQEVPANVATRPFPPESAVPHCESQAYFWARDLPDGTLKLYFAVDNPQGLSAKAMAVILDDTLSGAPLQQVAAVSEDLPFEIFGRELSMGKSMGLNGMVAMVRATARRKIQGGATAP